MNTAFTSSLSNAISDKIIEIAKKCPNRIKAAMYLHYDTPHYGNPQKCLLQLVMQAVIWKLCKRNEIKFVKTQIIEAPVKGASLYEFEMMTKDNISFNCYQLTTGYPCSPIDIMAQSIQEMQTEKGCTHCGFGAALDEDESCNFCMDGQIKKKLIDSIGDKVFSINGWKVFSNAIGPNYSEALLDLAKFHFKIISDESFRHNCAKIAADETQRRRSLAESDSDSFLGEEIENCLFLNFDQSFEIDEEYEDEDEE